MSGRNVEAVKVMSVPYRQKGKVLGKVYHVKSALSGQNYADRKGAGGHGARQAKSRLRVGPEPEEKERGRKIRPLSIALFCSLSDWPTYFVDATALWGTRQLQSTAAICAPPRFGRIAQDLSGHEKNRAKKWRGQFNREDSAASPKRADVRHRGPFLATSSYWRRGVNKLLSEPMVAKILRILRP